MSVADLEAETGRWPEYCEVAAQQGVCSVAAIPMWLEHPVGALNLYAAGPRDWSDHDLAAAGVMANMATAFLINAYHHRRQVELNAQLQTALDTRVVVEQAKGMVAAKVGCSPQEAFERMRSYARSRNATVHSVAEAVVSLGLSV